MLSYILQEKKNVAVSNLRFISRPNCMLNWVEHEKEYNLGPWPQIKK